jgi:hypothetical protein
MDFSKFKTSDWLIVGGGIGMLIFGTILDWLSYEGYGGANAFDFFFTGTVPWLLLVGAAVVTVLLVLDVIKAGSAPWPLMLLAGTALAVLLLLMRVLFNPGVPDGISRGIGMWLSLISGIAATAGAVMGFQAAGGSLKELTDMNKLKSSFGSGGEASATPPPEPPAPPTDA